MRARSTCDASEIEGAAEGGRRGALGQARLETPKSKLKGASKGMVKSMSETQLEELAATKRKGLPDKRKK